MFYPTIKINNLQHTLIAYLEAEQHVELAQIILFSDMDYQPQYDFSYIRHDQRKLFLMIRVPLGFRKKVESQKGLIFKFVKDIYQDDDDYALTKVELGVKAIQLENIEVEEKPIIVEKSSIYSSLLKRLIVDENLSKLHKQYLYEACTVGSQGNIMSATMMLGCAAEISLLELANAGYLYFKANKSGTEISNYESKVLKAKTAYTRLDEMVKRFAVEKTTFFNLGIENVGLFFSIFEIIRITRNEVGHPTGNILTKEEFEVQLSAYGLALNQYQKLIEGLPKIKSVS
jgi:hypothetical protein